MTISELTTLSGYMLVCSFTPGPGNVLALHTATQCSWRDSRSVILGICAGYGIVQLLCTLVLCCLDQLAEPVVNAMGYVGAGYMVWLGIHMMRSKMTEDTPGKPPSFLTGMLLQLVNIKIYFYISTLLSVYLMPHCKSIFSLGLAGLVTVGVGGVACFSWGILGAWMQDFYRRHWKVTNYVLGLFLFYCAWAIL